MDSFRRQQKKCEVLYFTIFLYHVISRRTYVHALQCASLINVIFFICGKETFQRTHEFAWKEVLKILNKSTLYVL
jgi:hypothetical protein